MTEKWYDISPALLTERLKTNLSGGLSKAEAEKRELYITHKVIARQSDDIEWFAHLSALGKDKLR